MSIVQKYSKRSYHCFPYSHGYMNKLFIYNLSSFLFLISHLFWEITESKLIDDLKGSVSRDFWPLFFHDSNPSGLLTNILIYFNSVLTSPSYFIVNFKNPNPVSLTPSWSQKIVGQNETLLFILEIYSPVIDVFTHKLIVPLKASRDQKKFWFRHWCDAHRAWSRTPNTESCLNLHIS